MENHKLLSMIGLSKKAGKLLQGYERVKEAVLLGNVKLVLVAEDLSPRSKQNIAYHAKEVEIPCLVIPATMEELGARTGKASGILGIADAGFSKAIQKILATNT